MRALLNWKNEHMHDAYVNVAIMCSVNDSWELYFMLINWAVIDICLRPCHRQHKCWRLDTESRDKTCTAFPLAIRCRLNYRWVFSLVVSHFWGCFNPALEGNWIMRLIPSHKMAAHFWFRTYDWFTYWPIAFWEII